MFDASDDFDYQYYDPEDFSNLCNLSKEGGFSVVHFNIRSFNSNADELYAFLDRLKTRPSIIVLSETWFSPAYTADIEAYCSYHVYRDARRGGGVSVYVRDDYTSRLIPRLSYVGENVEMCSVEVIAGISRVVVHGVYRPPDGDLSLFTEELLNVLSNARHNVHSVVIGDTNIDLITPSQLGYEFVNMCQSSSFIPLISVPTRVTEGHASCIDHIWYNKVCDVCTGVFKVDISDHYPIFVILPVQSNRHDFFTKTFRDHSNTSIANLRNEIYRFCNNFEILLFMNDNDVNITTQTFVDELFQVYNRCCPLRVKRISYSRFSRPWITDEHIISINHKHNMFRQYRQGIVSFQVYNTFKNQLTRVLRRAKVEYFNTKFRSSIGNTKENWNLIRTLVGGGRKQTLPDRIVLDANVLTEPYEVASSFNSYFANVAIDLERKIPHSNVPPLSFMGDRTQSSFFVAPVSDSDVSFVIGHLKNKSSGLQSVPVFVYKVCSDLLSPIIAKLFNVSVSCGVFPACLKVARIIPVFKRGDSTLVSNYRPISTLPTLSKIFEKLMCKKLCSFLKLHNILYDGQFGFRENSGTSDALLKFLHTAVGALDRKENVIAVFLDFAKAFDTVCHEILLDKMEHIGIRGVALEWFRTYVSSRKQYVGLGNSKSMVSEIVKGVPQGSVLGPILFLIYINDMRSCTKKLSLVHYADDTTVFLSGYDVQQLVSDVNLELDKLHEWLKCNRLSLNVDKTSFMVLTDKRNIRIPAISINNTNIRQVDRCNFLGITIDDKLSFKLHVKNVCNSVSKSIGIINRVSHIVPPTVKKNMYYSHVYSKVSYGILAWGGGGAVNAGHIERLLRRARKVVNYPHTDVDRITGDLLDFDSMYNYFSAVYFYKIVKMNCHPYFFNLIEELVPQRVCATRFSLSNSYNIPICTKSKTQRHFLYRSVHIWNDIPDEIKACQSLDKFKKMLRSELISIQCLRS